MIELTLEQKAMVRRIRMQMIAIGILTLSLVAALFQIYFSSNKVMEEPKLAFLFKGGVHDRVAELGIENYENTVKQTVLGSYRGIYFDSADLGKYLHKTWLEIKKRHTDHQKANGIDIDALGYEWKLGFYWLVRNEVDGKPIKPSLGYYVVPILVSKDGKTVLDYFKSSTHSYYAHPPSQGTTTTTSNGDSANNVHDEGHLWP